MTRKSMPLFESSLQKTEDWLEDVKTELGYEDLAPAYSTLRAVLHGLRDRLAPGEAADLAANMPMLVRGFYYEGWRPTADLQKRYRHKEDFLNHIASIHPRLKDEGVEKVVSGVFRTLTRHIPEGEIRDVTNQLPEDIRALWPDGSH